MMSNQKIQKKDRLLYAKMLILLGFGLAYVFLIQRFEAPDEPAHFLRAYGIAEGQFVLKDHPRELLMFILGEIEKNRGKIQIPVIADMRELLKISEDRIPNIAFNTSHYSPVPYLFHAGVIRFVMLFGDFPNHLMISFYLCRIMTLVLFSFVLFLSFKIIPDLSWIIFWIAATPMALSQSAVISPDYIVFCVSAMLLSASLGDMDDVTWILCVFPSVLFLFFSKIPYLPFLLIPLISAFLSKNRKRMLWLFFSIAVGTAGSAVWSYAVKSLGIYDSMLVAIHRYVNPLIQPKEQFALLMESPLKFGNVMYATLSETGMDICHQFVGVLGWQDIPVPFGLVLLWGIFSIAAIMVSEPLRQIEKAHSRILGHTCIISAFLTFLSIFLSIYLIWAPVGSDIVHVQGRYFHPVASVLFCGFVPLIRKKNISPVYTDRLKYAMLTGCVCIHIISLYAVIKKFS